MIVITKSVFTEDGVRIVRISGNLVSFSDSVLFSLKIFFKIENDIESIGDIDVVDDDMWFDSDIFFDDSYHLIYIIFIVDIFVAQLPIGQNIICVDTEQYFRLTLQ